MVSKQRLIKILAIFGLFLGVASADKVQVTADNFLADENKLISVLTGNVVIKKGSYDTLTSKKVEIFFDKEKQPIKYVATGNAKFKAEMKNTHYDGKGDILTYDPIANIYTLSGNAYLHDVENKREVFGEKIIVDQNKAVYEVKSEKKGPVKLIFEVEEK